MLNIVHRLVPDDTVKLSHTPPSYVTQGRLILDITISSWSINRFSVLFLYFILQVKPRLETSQGGLTPHQRAGNTGNSKPSRSASPRSRRGGYRKNWPYILQQQKRGFSFLHFLSFCFRRGSHLPFTDQSPPALTACTQRRRRRDAGPNAHLGLP